MSEPRLPSGAPRALRDFVACRSMRVELDLADLGWIPKPEGVSDALAPSVTIEDGATATSATIKIGYMGGYISVELPASIVDGQLVIDAGEVGLGIGPNITKWVDAFNGQLAENGKELDEFEVRGDRVAITKRAAAAPADTTSAVTTSTSATAAPAPEPAEPTEQRSRTGCLVWIAGTIAAVAAAIGIGVAVTNDGGDDAEESVVVTDPAPATTSTTTTTTTTTTTEPPPASTTTIAQVGLGDDEDDGDEVVVAPGLPRCGESDGLVAFGSAELPDGSCEYDGATDVFDPPCTYTLTCTPVDDAPIVFRGEPGWTHQRGGVDFVTGDIGASTWLEQLEYWYRRAGAIVRLQVASVCSGSQVTGASEPATDGPTPVEGPLPSFGLCERTTVTLTDEADRNWDFPQVGTYTVDASEPAPSPPSTSYAITAGDFDLEEPLFGDVATLHNAFGGRAATDDCIWFFEPNNVGQIRILDPCSMPDHFWVFAAGTTNVEIELSVTDTALGTTAVYANPLGQPSAPVVDVAAFDTSGPLFDRSVFPCGYGHLAYTACPTGEPAVQAGGFVIVSAAMGGDVPIAGDGAARAHHVDFGPAGGGRYSIAQDADGWTVTSTTESTRARALIRGNAVTLAVPVDELPEGDLAYVWSTEVDGSVHEQPVVPVVGVIRTPEVLAPSEPVAEDEPPTEDAPPSEDEPPAEDTGEDADDDADAAAPPEATETLADFYSQLSASVAAGDAGFSLDRLDPRVFDVYPDSCPAALSSFADPDLSIEFVEQGDFEPWTYEANGQSIEIPDALTVTVRLTGRGQDGVASEAHLTIIDGEYHWFTFC